MDVEFFASACKESIITNGFTFETDFPEPISSGGSTAIKSGARFTNSATSCAFYAHTIDTISKLRKRSTKFLIALLSSLCSL